MLAKVAHDVRDGVSAFFAQHPPGLLRRYSGVGLFRAVVFQCTGEPTSCLIATFLVLISNVGEIKTSDHVVRVFGREEPFEVCKFGETDYVNEHVLSGSGRMHLPQKFFDLVGSSCRIGDLSVCDAEIIANALISAAEITSATIPIPSGVGIGGGTTTLLVGPERVDIRDSKAR